MKTKHTLPAAFKAAFNGIRLFFWNERNGKIQLAVSILVIIASAVLQISPVEWMFVCICIGMVILSEILNSAVEKICDLISESYHPAIKIIKDISAAAVLWAAILSVIIGCIIFIPKIFFF